MCAAFGCVTRKGGMCDAGPFAEIVLCLVCWLGLFCCMVLMYCVTISFVSGCFVLSMFVICVGAIFMLSCCGHVLLCFMACLMILLVVSRMCFGNSLMCFASGMLCGVCFIFSSCIHLLSVLLYLSSSCMWQFGHGVVIGFAYVVWHV